jgi:hypothetical protein
MKLLFDDEFFSFETLCSVGFSVYDGADSGEAYLAVGRVHSSNSRWPQLQRQAVVPPSRTSSVPVM